ncbi:hypothetical protein BC829DRAFT_450432 [Chytridium lagenaria]|nr:hypothetical protein BC829DRAFT_450432 [Chytridium lagenaria]
MPPEPATSKLKGSNFTASETLQLLKAVRAKLPKGQNDWLNVETFYNNLQCKERRRDSTALKNRFLKIRSYTGVFSKNITEEAVTEAVAIQSLIDTAVCVAKGGGPVGLSNEEEERLFGLMDQVLPISEQEWQFVESKFNDDLPPGDHKNIILFKRHFDQLVALRKPTGDPDCPENVRTAKRLDRRISERASGGDVPSSGDVNDQNDENDEAEEDEETFSTHRGKESDDGDEDLGEVDDLIRPRRLEFPIPLPQAITDENADPYDIEIDYDVPLKEEAAKSVSSSGSRSSGIGTKRKVDEGQGKKVVGTFSLESRLGAQGLTPNNVIKKEIADYKSLKASKRSRVSSTVGYVVEKGQKDDKRHLELAAREYELEEKRLELEYQKMKAEERREEALRIAEERRIKEDYCREEAERKRRSDERKTNYDGKRRLGRRKKWLGRLKSEEKKTTDGQRSVEKGMTR